MLILDCDTRESTLETVAATLGTSPASLEGFLRPFDLEAHCDEVNPPHEGCVELQQVVESSLGCKAQPLDRVCWFHLTRTRAASDFERGIYPLTKSLDMVWDTILDVFRGTPHEERLSTMRTTGVDNYQYNLKTRNSFHAGPYAVLVKEFALRPDLFYGHDYLRMPEIIEDICGGYQKKYGVAIEQALFAALHPVIVKFWAVPKRSASHLQAALFYLYRAFRGDGFGLAANDCYDNRNAITEVDP